MKNVLVALTTAAWFLAGCGGAPEQASQETAIPATEQADGHDHAHANSDQADGHDHAHANSDQAAQTTPAAQAIPAGTQVTLTGTVGCGHCTYQIGNSCSTAMQTAEGTIWVIEGVGADDPLFENRFEGAEITMEGTVSYVDGVAHLTPAPDDAQTEM